MELMTLGGTRPCSSLLVPNLTSIVWKSSDLWTLKVCSRAMQGHSFHQFGRQHSWR